MPMMMNRRQVSALLLSLPVFPSTAAGATTEAGPIDPPVSRVDAHDLQIKVPGKYKLSEDIVVSKTLAAFMGWEAGKGGSLISLFTGQVELDLDGHTIDIRHDKSAILLSEQSNRELAAKFGARVARADGRAITLRNGTIDVSEDDRSNNAVELTDAWTSPAQMRMAHGEDSNGAGRIPNDVPYVRNDYLLEKLKVLSRGVSVAVEGGYNVIRNCVIDSAGNAAIFSAGPNVLIENCEIRLRALVEGQHSSDTPLRAAIVLRDGTNAIIRNNRIRVDSGGLPSVTHCVLVRDGAANVRVENNTFINVDGETITPMEGAQVTSRGNTSEHRAWPW